MKTYQLVSLFSVGALLSLSACSGGGGGLSTGGRDLCPKNYSLAPDTLRKGETEYSLDPADPDPAAQQVPAGLYKYDGSSLYYVDTTSDLRVLVMDSKQLDPTVFKVGVECYRNATPGMKGVAFQVEGVSDMDVDASGKSIITTRNFNFTVDNSVALGKFEKGSEGVSKSPKEVFESPGNPTETHAVHFVKTSPDGKPATDFQIRTTGNTARGVFELIIRMKREDKPAPIEPAP